jgi:hypothetical protein
VIAVSAPPTLVTKKEGEVSFHRSQQCSTVPVSGRDLSARKIGSDWKEGIEPIRRFVRFFTISARVVIAETVGIPRTPIKIDQG